MNTPFTSLLVPRDKRSVDALAELGVPVSFPSTLSEVFSAVSQLGARPSWAKIATYRATEHVLDLDLGAHIRSASADLGTILVFDWDDRRRYGGVTRVLAEVLFDPPAQGPVPGLFYAGGREALFHPKVILMGYRLRRGDELRVAVAGSGNLTRGGAVGNSELGVLHVERGRPASDISSARLEAWPDLQSCVDAYFARATSFLAEDLPYLADDAQELAEWTERDQASVLRLRLYQRQAADAVVRAWHEHRYKRRPSSNWRGAMVVLPPAAGKTLCALTAAHLLLRSDNAGVKTVAWLSDRPLLAAQAYDEFSRTGFLRRGVVGVHARDGHVRRATVGIEGADEQLSTSIKSFYSSHRSLRSIVFMTKGDGRTRRALLDQDWPDVVIVDEAHHSVAPVWDDVLTEMRPYLVVGLTATPYRKAPESGGTQSLLTRFTAGDEAWLACFPAKRRRRIRRAIDDAERRCVAYQRTVPELFDRAVTGLEEPVLAEPSFVIVSVRDESGEPLVVSPKGDARARIRFLENPFESERDLSDLVRDPDVVEAALEQIDSDVVDRVSKAVRRGKTVMLFARNIAHAEELEWQLPEDVDPVVLHSDDDTSIAERRMKVATLREQGHGALITVDMATEGLDLPSADVLVIPRWTSSERLFWQMLGRGLRGPGAGGNKRVEIVTYDLRFADAGAGDPSEAGAGSYVERVDEVLCEAFGRHHRLVRPHPIRVDATPTAKGRPAFDAARPASRRQGAMYDADIARAESLGLGGEGFEVIVRGRNGVTEQRVVKRAWRVLRNLYDKGLRGARYRFVVRSL